MTEPLPTVFQCRECRAILGDSTTLVSAQQEAVTISDGSKLTVNTDAIETSQKGLDRGSTYEKVECSQCKAVIGRRYLTTPRELDNLRDQFTLQQELLSTYQIGASAGNDDDASGSCEVAPGGSVAIIDGKLLVCQLPQVQDEVVELRENIFKVQHMLIALNERLVSVESCVVEQPESEHSNGGHDEEESSKRQKI